MTSDALDHLIRSALNDPLGRESPPAWRPALRKRRPGWLAGALPAAAVAAAAAFLLVPGRSSSVLQNAAAALRELGHGSVLHLVYVSKPLHPSLLDLRTGKVRRQTVKTSNELWYDLSRHVFREVFQSPAGTYVIWRSPTELLTSDRGRQPASSFEVPPEVRLFGDYQRALASGKAVDAGDGTVAGHEVFFVELYRRGGVVERFAVDRHTYLPVAVCPCGHGYGNGREVASVQLVPRRAAELAKPGGTLVIMDPRTGQIRAASTAITFARARIWLGRSPVGLEDTLADLPLSAARGDHLSPVPTLGRSGLELVFGRSCSGRPLYRGAYVLVEESPKPEPAYGNFGRVPYPHAVLFAHAESSYPECGVPAQDQDGFGQPAHDRIWATAFRVDGLYISVSSPRRSLAVAATMQLLREGRQR